MSNRAPYLINKQQPTLNGPMFKITTPQPQNPIQIKRRCNCGK
jgi:hypothetical protein